MNAGIIGVITLLLLSSSNPALGFTENQYYTIWANESEQIIGVMPHVEITTDPNSKVCVQWYENGYPALAPTLI